jgi:excisionase family DNA binding protein
MEVDDMTEPLIDVKQVQKRLGLSERTIFKLIRENELKGFKVGRAWRFEESDIGEYITRQRIKAELQRDKRQAMK